jgi:hypothetical protein
MKAIVLMLMLILPSTSLGQTSKPILVHLTNENKDDPEVFNALTAGIEASGRFKTSDYNAAALLADVECMKIPEFRDAYVCDIEITYQDAGSGLHSEMEGRMAKGSVEYVANNLFQAFVMNTRDERIQTARTGIMTSVSVYCADAAHASECHGK